MTALVEGLLDTLTVRTVRVESPAALVELLPATGGLAWVRDGAGLVGWGEVARVELRGQDRFAVAQAWWDEVRAGAQVQDEVGLPGCGPVLFASFAFDPDSPSVLVVPEVVVGVRDGVWWVTTWGATPSLAAQPAPAPPTGVVVDDRSGPAYVAAVAEAVRRISRGELAKVVLSRAVDAVADAPVDVRGPLRALAEGYPGCWTFLVDGLFGATPELLVRLEGGRADSRVLAGTLRRPVDDAHDAAQAALLARSRKDLEEHAYAVQSVASALAEHCRGVEVPASPFVLHLPNVMHLASDVRGEVADGSSVLALADALHPSAAVCGTPTADARELLELFEPHDRGRYAGPVGWVDGAGDGEFGLALRCAQVDPADPRRLRLHAGGGIVAGSQPDDELAETVAKLVPVLQALGVPTR